MVVGRWASRIGQAKAPASAPEAVDPVPGAGSALASAAEDCASLGSDIERFLERVGPLTG
jgi:hypothetical protein